MRFDRLSGPTRRLLATEGESGRFEFKRNADAVGSSTLVAAANAAALEGLGQVTILVGVDETTDPKTGVVTGKVVGLADLDRERGKITHKASSTLPIPVGLTVVEENVSRAKPILRLEVRPTLKGPGSEVLGKLHPADVDFAARLPAFSLGARPQGQVDARDGRHGSNSNDCDVGQSRSSDGEGVQRAYS